MVEHGHRAGMASEIFHALADAHRRRILELLRARPRSVGELVEALGIAQPGVTRHLGVLERAGLVTRRAEGRRRICALRADGFRTVDAWLAGYRGFWEHALDRLAELAEETADEHGDERDDDDRDGRDGDHGHPRDRGEP